MKKSLNRFSNKGMIANISKNRGGGYKPLLTLFKNKKLLSGGMAAILGLASVFAIIPGVKASAMLGQGASSGDVATKQLTTGVIGILE